MKKLQPVTFFAVALLLAGMAMWQYFDFYETGLLPTPLFDFGIWTATIALLSALLIGWVSGRVFRFAKAPSYTALLVFLLVVFALSFPEAAVRLTGQYHIDYGNPGHTFYASPNIAGHSGWIRKHSPGAAIAYKTGEFETSHMANALGYRDKEWSKVKPSGVDTRVLLLGDSFTEGVGAQRSWGEHLEEMLNTTCGQPIEVMNAGVGGSDIVYELKKLEHELLAYQLDVVLLCLNSTDIFDIVARGCTERIQMRKGKPVTRYKPAPRWEYFYGISHMVRWVCAMSGRTIGIEPTPTLLLRAEICIREHLVEFKQLTTRENIRFAVVFQPLDTDIKLGSNLVLQDLITRVARWGMTYVDLFPYFKDVYAMDSNSVYHYYWPIDRHLKDYKIVAEGVLNNLGCDYFAMPDSSAN